MKLDAATRFALLCKHHGLPAPEPEFRFASPRRWRFDLCWPAQGVALEVEGGVWTGGRHTRGSGFVKDMTKYNEAALRGWKVLRATPSQLCTEETIAMLKRALSITEAA